MPASTASDPVCAERGAFHRAVALVGGAGSLHAEVEDDFHHFAIDLHHDGTRVTAVHHRAIRHPWSLCPSAGARLGELVGAPLDPSLSRVLGYGAIRSHCTHMYDIACLAIAAAARGLARRRFDMAVQDRREDRAEAWLRRDDGLVLHWHVEGTRIIAPAPFAGVSLKHGFPDWAGTALPSEQAEAAILLRRAVFVSNGRRRDLDLAERASDGARNIGGCFVMREGVADKALRMGGATRDFSRDPNAVLVDFPGPG